MLAHGSWGPRREQSQSGEAASLRTGSARRTRRWWKVRFGFDTLRAAVRTTHTSVGLHGELQSGVTSLNPAHLTLTRGASRSRGLCGRSNITLLTLPPASRLEHTPNFPLAPSQPTPWPDTHAAVCSPAQPCARGLCTDGSGGRAESTGNTQVHGDGYIRQPPKYFTSRWNIKALFMLTKIRRERWGREVAQGL